MKVKTAILALLFCGLFLLCGCGNKVADEKQLLKDLNDAGTPISTAHNVSFSSLKIEKRKTDESAKTDTVYVWAEGESDTLACKVSYVLEYELYNDGWLLENVFENNTSQWKIVPKEGVSRQKVESDLAAMYSFDELEFVDYKENLEARTCEYIYKLKTEYNYLTEFYTVQCSYRLLPDSPDWQGEFARSSPANDWQLEGLWHTSAVVEDGMWHNKVQLDVGLYIENIDSETLTMEFAVETEGSSWLQSMSGDGDYKYGSYKPIKFYKDSYSQYGSSSSEDYYMGYINYDNSSDMISFQSDETSNPALTLCQFIFDRDTGIRFESYWMTGMIATRESLIHE